MKEKANAVFTQNNKAIDITATRIYHHKAYFLDIDRFSLAILLLQPYLSLLSPVFMFVIFLCVP
jgi:hypothetical protein